MLRKQNYFDNLPKELIHKIFSFLNFKNLYILSRVNKKFKNKIENKESIENTEMKDRIFEVSILFQENKKRNMITFSNTYNNLLREFQLIHSACLEKEEKIALLHKEIDSYQPYAEGCAINNQGCRKSIFVAAGTPSCLTTFFSLCCTNACGLIPTGPLSYLGGISFFLGALSYFTVGGGLLCMIDIVSNSYRQEIDNKQDEINIIEKEIKKPVSFIMK